MGDTVTITVKHSQQSQIPDWIKNNANWWSKSQIPDKDFINGIAYLIKMKIISVPSVTKSEHLEEKVPNWVRNNAGWWSQGLVTDDEFLNGLSYLIKVGIITVDSSMKISSDVFSNNGMIPSEYSCDGANISPKLVISNVPANAKSLVLIMTDPDAPSGIFTHWLVWNLSPTKSIISKGETLTEPQGLNDFGVKGYGGPCPPNGIHRYVFSLYALDAIIDIPSDSKKQDLESTINSHVIEKDELVGMYSRK